MWDAQSITLIVGSYLIGAIPSAYLIVRLFRGIDIRRYGSGSAGISNVFVQAGLKAAVPLVLFDTIVKGSVPVILASDLVFDMGLTVEVTAAFASIAGHNWSVFMRFRGGRGLATASGAMVTLNWPLPVLYSQAALLGLIFRKDSAIGWAISAITLPAWALVLRLESEIVYFTLAFVGMVFIKRLLSNPMVGIGHESEKIPLPRLIVNRLILDRDIADRSEWIRRIPPMPKGDSGTGTHDCELG